MSKRLHSNHEKTGIYKSSGLHKAFINSEIPILVKSSNAKQKHEKNRLWVKNEYLTKQNRTINTITNL